MPRLNFCQYLRLFEAYVESSNSLEPIPFWEANSRLAAQEFPNMWCNQKINYRVHKRPSLIPIQSQINPTHTIVSHPVEYYPATHVSDFLVCYFDSSLASVIIEHAV
jgi:hypothetical protein